MGENKTATLQGYGLDENEESGRLLELQLRIISNEECYQTYSNLFKTSYYFFSIKEQIKNALHDGINEGIMCSKSTCNSTIISQSENVGRSVKCDAAEGDSGAPLITIGSTDEKSGEQKNLKLVGIHSGGSPLYQQIR